jgi:hypothetical protein
MSQQQGRNLLIGIIAGMILMVAGVVAFGVALFIKCSPP